MVHVRVMRTAILVLALLSSVVGCTLGGTETIPSGTSDQTASGEALVVDPSTCPKNVQAFLNRNDVQGMNHALVPGKPRYLAACNGRLRVAVTNEQQVAVVANALNDLKLVRRGLIFDCAVRGRMQRDRALFFTYADGYVLAV